VNEKLINALVVFSQYEKNYIAAAHEGKKISLWDYDQKKDKPVATCTGKAQISQTI
jgi:hypothetical protein